MAKRKKRSGKRRRVGALSLTKKGSGMTLLSLAAGYFLADTINPQVDKIVPKTKNEAGVEVPNSTLAMAGQIGLGGLLLMGKPFGKGMIQTAAGGVLAGAGLKRALKAAGVIKGYQAVPVLGRRRSAAGYQSVPVIGKTVTPPQLSGVPAQLQGYRVNGYKSQGSGVLAGYGGDNGGSGITNGSVSGYMG
jgi:hypothetical protein